MVLTKEFIDFLCGLAGEENRAALARLRRGLGKAPGTSVEMYPVIVPHLYGKLSRNEEDACYLVAALFALHPRHESGLGSLGETLRRVAAASPDEQSTERRFAVLLESDTEQLPHRLRQAVSLAKSKELSINYERLLEDIIHWETPQRRVQQQWAKDFWGSREKPSETEQ